MAGVMAGIGLEPGSVNLFAGLGAVEVRAEIPLTVNGLTLIMKY
jgi:hypothetical protein